MCEVSVVYVIYTVCVSYFNVQVFSCVGLSRALFLASP